jgi:hypothetical protein
MSGDLDIWRCAALMIRRYGSNADLEAQARAERLREDGDRAGQKIWLRVTRAITDLINVRPHETMH